VAEVQVLRHSALSCEREGEWSSACLRRSALSCGKRGRVVSAYSTRAGWEQGSAHCQGKRTGKVVSAYVCISH